MTPQYIECQPTKVGFENKYRFRPNLKHRTNILEGRCRKGDNGGDSTLLSSKEVTMATEPQSTSQG